MVIEWLSYRVPEADQAAFMAADAAVWTAALAGCAGFRGKETWRRADAPDQIDLIIRWETREAWKAVPGPLLAETETRFRAMFTGEAEFRGCTDLDVA